MSYIYVFGSNLAGRHGKGSALEALKNHGAIYGQGEGFQGNSYAIPTKGFWMEVLSLDRINISIDRFMSFAFTNPQYIFNVVAIGCGLAGYTSDEIAPMFENATDNVILPKEFRQVLMKLDTVDSFWI